MSNMSSECDENNVSAIDASVEHTLESAKTAKENFPGGGQSGGFRSRIFRRTRSENYQKITDQPKYANMKIIYIPSRKVGSVIGRGGQIIKSLQNQAAAKVIVGNTLEDITGITIFGSEQAISQAEHMIKKLTIETEKPKPHKNALPPKLSNASSSNTTTFTH